jgi:hypothetical protein
LSFKCYSIAYEFGTELNKEGCTLIREDETNKQDELTSLPLRKDLDFAERIWEFCQGYLRDVGILGALPYIVFY